VAKTRRHLLALFATTLPTNDLKQWRESHNILIYIDKKIRPAAAMLKKVNLCNHQHNRLIKNVFPSICARYRNWPFLSCRRTPTTSLTARQLGDEMQKSGLEQPPGLQIAQRLRI
jgi:hypothetical protein